MEKNTKRFAIGAAIAAGVGFVTGILTAPKSGKETRDEVKSTAVKAKREAEKELKKLHSDLNGHLDKVKKLALEFGNDHKDDMGKVVATATAAKEKARNVLSAIHDGGADDKDLHSAIKEVQEAVDHLKKYLAKTDSK